MVEIRRKENGKKTDMTEANFLKRGESQRTGFWGHREVAELREREAEC